MNKIITILTLTFLLNLKAHSPSWTNKIACIIYTHCTGCHNTNGIAPFSLTTFNEVVANKYGIINSVKSKRMPPFAADFSKNQWAHANVMSDHDIEDLEEWITNGTPFGELSKEPAVPTYPAGGEMKNPDVIFKIPNFLVNTATDLYKYFIIPTNLTSNKNIQSIEVVPSNRNITHHALVYASKDSNTKVDKANMITGYVPGQRIFQTPIGFGIPIEAKSYLIVQIHYPGGIYNVIDSTAIKIKYTSGTVRQIVTNPVLNHSSTLLNGPLFIPANTQKTFHSAYTAGINATLHGISPHMHLIGKSIHCQLVLPSNDTVDLIDVPKWDFEWQGYYMYKKPIKIPNGSRLIVSGVYDNTTANNNNPNKPPQNVSLGEGTNDEMFLVYFVFSAYQAGDENLVFDADTTYARYKNCTGEITSLKSKISIPNLKPNPANDFVDLPNNIQTNKVELISVNGKIHTLNVVQNRVNLQQLPTGIYIMQLQNNGIIMQSKLHILH